MSWIRLSIAAAAFLGVASVAGAQGTPPVQGGTPPEGQHGGQGRGGMSKMLFNGIDLTDAQKDQVQKIMDKYKAEREALRPAGGTMHGPPDDATRARMKDLMTRSTAEYHAILNASQQAIFDKNVAEMKARMDQRQHQQH